MSSLEAFYEEKYLDKIETFENIFTLCATRGSKPSIWPTKGGSTHIGSTRWASAASDVLTGCLTEHLAMYKGV